MTECCVRPDIGESILFAAIILITGCIAGQPTLATPELDACESEVMAAFESFAEAHNLPGVAFAGGDPDSTLLYGTIGDIGAKTVIPVGSAAKWPATIIILGLVAEGKLDLDKPISTYLPNAPAVSGRITLRQALSHTAGVAPDAVFQELGDDGVKQSAYRLLERPLIARPGTEFHYGGSSFQIAAAAAEAVTGESWTMLSRRRLEQPLSIDTFDWGHPFHGTSHGTPQIGGGLYSSMDDYATFLRTMAAGGAPLVTQRSFFEMTTDVRRDLPAPGVPEVVDEEFGYGLGVWCMPPPKSGDRCSIIHSAGGFGTFPTLDVNAGIWSLIFVNDRIRGIFDHEQELGRRIRQCVEELRRH